MSGSSVLALFVILLICAFIAAQIREQYPAAGRVAWALLSSALILFSVAALLGTLESLEAGVSASSTRAGSRVLVDRSNSPWLFWLVTVVKLFGELLFFAGGTWAFAQALKLPRKPGRA